MTEPRLRPATRADLSRIHEVCRGTSENRLTDRALVTDAEVEWYMDEAIFLVQGAEPPFVGLYALLKLATLLAASRDPAEPIVDTAAKMVLESVSTSGALRAMRGLSGRRLRRPYRPPLHPRQVLRSARR